MLKSSAFQITQRGNDEDGRRPKCQGGRRENAPQQTRDDKGRAESHQHVHRLALVGSVEQPGFYVSFRTGCTGRPSQKAVAHGDFPDWQIELPMLTRFSAG